jgi:hypothetical protein
METDDFQRLLSFFKILADENRLRILGLVAQQERSVGELAELLGVKDPTVSHHLAKLKALDLLRKRQDRNTRFYGLNPAALNDLKKVVFTPDSVAALVETEATREDERSPRRKVLKAFVDGERLIKIPGSRKKRDVILEWLVQDFERGARYPEKKLNEIIGQHHPDTATLRRELVASKRMKRKNGVYWRV